MPPTPIRRLESSRDAQGALAKGVDAGAFAQENGVDRELTNGRTQAALARRPANRAVRLYNVGPTRITHSDVTTMLTIGRLEQIFQIYWKDMNSCRTGKAFWSLLHVTVCLPDICAALETPDAKTSAKRYIEWSEKNLKDSLLSGEERYAMRCKVLHEGRAGIGGSTRYSGFAFTQPAPNGQIDHRRVEGTTLILDVGELSVEYEKGVRAWIQALEANPGGTHARSVEQNLSTIVQVRAKLMPIRLPGVITYSNRTS